MDYLLERRAARIAPDEQLLAPVSISSRLPAILPAGLPFGRCHNIPLAVGADLERGGMRPVPGARWSPDMRPEGVIDQAGGLVL
jgi:hypothetical protein